MTAVRSRARGQSGFTLIELMLGITVSAMVLIPLLAWMAMGIRIGTKVQNTSIEVRQRNLLGSYLVRDGASAASAAAGGADCVGGEGGGGTVVLSLVSTNGTRFVYSVTDGAGGGTVYRRICVAGGAPTSVTQLVEGAVRPAAGWSASLLCSARPGVVGDTCGRVDLGFVNAAQRVILASATRRIVGPQ